MRRLYARLYLRHEMHIATFLTQTSLSQTFASHARTIRMAEKTLKASPLSNRRFERSEYPRHRQAGMCTLKRCPSNQ